MKKTHITKLLKQSAALSLGVLLIGASVVTLIEPNVVRGQSDTENVDVNLTVDAGISITDCGTDVTMTDDSSNNMSQTVDRVVAECQLTVETNNNSGYTLEVEASTSPAMQHDSTSDSFADYSESTAGTPEQWSVTSAYEFGFSVHGTDVSDGTYDNGNSSCDTAAELDSGSNLDYQGFTGTTKIQVASSGTETPSGGTNSTLCFGAEQAGVLAPSGSYTATITQTATVQ